MYTEAAHISRPSAGCSALVPELSGKWKRPGRIAPGCCADTDCGGGTMHTKQSEAARSACFRIEPEKQLCPIYDEVGIRTFPTAEPDEMGFRVVDDFVQEHIQ